MNEYLVAVVGMICITIYACYVMYLVYGGEK